MSIVQLTTDTTGQLNVNPRRVKLISTDTLAVITTAGYLNNKDLQGYTINPSDVFDVYYLWTTTNPLQGSGTYAVFTCTVSLGVITLVQWSNSGDVTLPTVAGDISVFSNTSGTMSDTGISSTAPIFLGNVQAGASGTAGDFISYPATGSKGSLILKAVANTGNTITTISNAAMGQASVISIPDPGTATAEFAIAPAALVNGNLVSASGTAGLVQDSAITAASVSGAITQLGQLQQISVTLNTAAVVAAYATPQVLIPAVAGKVAVVHSANVYTASTGNTAYATGTAPIIQYGTTIHGAGTIATGAGLVTGDIEAAASQVRTLGAAASAVYTGITNTAVTFSCATAYTAGTGTNVVFTLVYELITATV